MYKIRNKDGLFSTGGGNHKWHETGKTWKKLGHISSHLGPVPFQGYNGETAYDGTEEIVEFELVEKSVIPLRDHVASQTKRREKKELQERARSLPYKLRDLKDHAQDLERQLQDVRSDLRKLV